MWHTFVYTFCLSHTCFGYFLFNPCNCKQWLKYQQSWANHCFRIDGLEHLDTISLIDVYELTIHAAIQQESPLICIVKLTFCDKHEPLSTKMFKTTDNCHICVLAICIRTKTYRRLVGLKTSNRGIQALS